MTRHPSKPDDHAILGFNATDALKQALRAKKQNPATLIVRREADLHTFTPLNWIRFCVARAQNNETTFAAQGGAFLGKIFADVTPMSPSLFNENLRAIAGTLHDNLAHPTNLRPDQIELLQTLWNALPELIRSAHHQPQPSPNIADAVLDPPETR